ncbi:tRNA 5-methylaminomethyl-2-thiouridine biosynthesis bifunctional protein MnmC [BD1-7 clade bacterium]|uniref:tRNA 5-methylaminomethyl-2-thiouridine biosynthesis bifunctional protein MnmC n=1 Tax=BD1-7 clade bacterium TaxID=2029982 RepID=A0A5S9PA82_9GAMM|nr:tRNA 5-methylaminomethyl-2-thiouridine biosynthesis bifunctional protein MnmC [BD1-7 clade bacterium]
MTSFSRADISWRNSSTPVSTDYDDVYFSADDGAAESHFVFLQNNYLTERFSTLLTAAPRAAESFVIAETGFGTGLNFLQAATLWRQFANADDQLVFISCELHPLQKDDLIQALSAWSGFADVREALIRDYPPLIQGMHTLELFDNVRLILLFNDVIDGFSALLENDHRIIQRQPESAVNAWFLDGFAPSKNPDMWTDRLFNLMARLSNRDTTYASFTAAGIVRRGLKSAGFTVNKVKGFGKKREMIRGGYAGFPEVFDHTHPVTRNSPNKPFWPIYRPSLPSPPRTALVVGAGIAGCTTAKALSEAGIATTLIDTADAPMMAASGNPQGVLFPKLSHRAELLSEFNLFSLLYADRYYQQPAMRAGYYRTGMLQLIDNPSEQHTLLHQRFSAVDIAHRVSAKDASDIAGTRLNHEAIWYPQTGWVRQNRLREAFTQHSDIEFRRNETLNNAQKQADGRWQITTSNAVFQVDLVVLCTASATNTLLSNIPDSEALPTKPIRGQVSEFDSTGLPALKTVICHKGYICPSAPDEPDVYTCGASYELKNTDLNLNDAIHSQNLQNLADYLPDFSTEKTGNNTIRGRVGFRCTTPDYLPMVGPLFNVTGFDRTFSLLGKNARSHIPLPGSYHDGLFVNIGHGSRGFGSAPISAALITAYALSRPLPIPFPMAAALNPARFVIRDITRNRR